MSDHDAVESARAAQARPAQGADEHASEHTQVRERTRAGGNAAMGRISERAQ
jgi:hypothetical protein